MTNPADDATIGARSTAAPGTVAPTGRHEFNLRFSGFSHLLRERWRLNTKPVARDRGSGRSRTVGVPARRSGTLYGCEPGQRPKTMERRTFMKGAGVTAGALAAGGIGITQLTGGARATANTDLGSASVTSDDGTVQHVSVYGDSVINWEGFENGIEAIRTITRVAVTNQNSNSVISKRDINDTGALDVTNGDWGGDGESITLENGGTSGTIKADVGLRSNGKHNPDTDWAIIQASDHEDPYGLPTDPAPAAPLEVDTDGESQTYTVHLYSLYIWYRNADGTGEEFRKEFESTFDLTVNNVGRNASGSTGPGDDGVSAG